MTLDKIRTETIFLFAIVVVSLLSSKVRIENKEVEEIVDTYVKVQEKNIEDLKEYL